MREVAADLAWFFHWPPEVVWRMTLDDIEFWAAQSVRIAKSQELPR